MASDSRPEAAPVEGEPLQRYALDFSRDGRFIVTPHHFGDWVKHADLGKAFAAPRAPGAEPREPTQAEHQVLRVAALGASTLVAKGKLVEAPAEPAGAGPSDEMARLIEWVAERWHAEVYNRPLVNVHRRSLDDTWRQVLRRLGVNDEARLGPKHDDLLAAQARKDGK